MKTFVTADHHFYDTGAIKHHNRPFSCLQEMHETMVELWNHIVAPNDQVFHLGDLMVRATATKAEILGRLNGQKFLIPGNHDCRNDYQKGVISKYFTILDKIVEDMDHRVVMCHYGLITWMNHHDGDVVNFHGHSHGRLVPSRMRLDIGVDLTNFVPLEINDAIRIAKMYPDQRKSVPYYKSERVEPPRDG